ncbi:hypothetical protein ACWZHB_26980 [Nocardia sp. FBN12]|uniref:hypothetical protein n=1 Tax=Nocardia sp. FBN12 TaxID=3419766 RepID=UPI003CFE2567
MADRVGNDDAVGNDRPAAAVGQRLGGLNEGHGRSTTGQPAGQCDARVLTVEVARPHQDQILGVAAGDPDDAVAGLLHHVFRVAE